MLNSILWSKIRTFMPPKISAWMLRTEILNQNFQKVPPVLIYQFGKVGSSTLRVSLRRSPLKRPVYQVHRLSEEGVNNYREKYETAPHSIHLADNLAISETLRKTLLETNEAMPKLSVITLTRDPVAAMLSTFFQALDNRRGHEFRNADGTPQTDRIISVIHRKFKEFDESTNRICTWFDRELKTTFGIDVFEHPFDPEQGYQVIQTDQVDLLLLRLEDLNQVGEGVVSEFLGLPSPLKLKNRNQRDRQKIADLYSYVKANLDLPRPVCRKIYESRYATHFYSPAERKAFINTWAVERRVKNEQQILKESVEV
ncbi:MAG: putative capsular polysaccharide synthesis family protein [Leptolyngbyaceae bacterium]|nr:putative capsular polysaccharide synthesis family protein [Leptolyngbyaceae bacterium]